MLFLFRTSGKKNENTDRSVCTLDDSQQDDNDKEEEGDVEDHSVQLVFISSWVLDFVSNTTASAYTDVHVEQVTLQEQTRRCQL